MTAIEAPQTTYVVKEEKLLNGAGSLVDSLDEEILAIRHKPVTSKIRSSLKHLESYAGYRSRWRGVSVFFVYIMVHGLLTEFLQAHATRLAGLTAFGFTGVYAGRVIASAITSILLARLSLTWTHIVISEPSSKLWYRRVPPFRAWKNIWAATAAADIACRLPIMFSAVCFSATGSPQLGGARDQKLQLTALVACFVIGFITFIGLAVPAYVTMIRIQASMLPEEHKSIVPFDRTFGGRAIPEILGGTVSLGYLDAWKTFDRPARLRMLRLLVKNILIEVALHGFFAFVVGCEIITIIGPGKMRDFFDQQIS